MIKKIIYTFILFAFITSTVYADENKIYFTESDGRIYYQDYDHTFMNHPDMVPGREYTDILSLENETSIKYGLYVKLKKINDSAAANELFDNINMKIYIDDNLIFEGSARGLTIVDGEEVLNDIIKLVDMHPNTTHTLMVKTQLSRDYTNINYTDATYVNWVFYASYGDPDEPIEPDDPVTPDEPVEPEYSGESEINGDSDTGKNTNNDKKIDYSDLEEIKKVPKTFDNILYFIIILLISLLSLTIMIIANKKMKKMEE